MTDADRIAQLQAVIDDLDNRLHELAKAHRALAHRVEDLDAEAARVAA